MLPDKCSVTEEGKQCVNPPEFVVSIISGEDEYMVGVPVKNTNKLYLAKLGFFKMKEKSMMEKLVFHLLKLLELIAFMVMQMILSKLT